MRGPRLRQPKRKRVMHDHSEDRYVSGCAQSTDLVIVPFVNTPVALFASKKLVGVPLPKALLIHFLELYAVLLASLALRHSASTCEQNKRACGCGCGCVRAHARTHLAHTRMCEHYVLPNEHAHCTDTSRTFSIPDHGQLNRANDTTYAHRRLRRRLGCRRH